ncbi:bifunctional aldolase/short-chain dehydrogenase [Conexibacter sp. JD483]|uniref:bifunctional aldolase/short-chain dehydrogenase n=1 Tax=unclassified Conexibacter TaxID=2627773 RepID=UPI0027184A87|nr:MULTISPECIES: bifunctional aldolase/short-chain dehydrogenase [unclassified Conexibacter]MDO8184968.1 bifunctional aldolase/short-chain dehydrogenase [Conexibacter sp. CPCC 205706]MDO8198112.1 bifunctional aldolase/short-chain dehydrogenase [Conexibacter sp. CPCC 205762]MDR9368266.1 bifunctional aldolase/short-chain dehydrogenase [Conexibacter sp. JD483]
MSHTTDTATPVAPRAESLYDASKAPKGGLDELVYRSNLLGANRAVSNYGGGNTSSKSKEIDHAGREVDTLWVKGSGSDLATMGAKNFTGLRLEEILPLIERDEMSDEEMVEYLGRSQVAPDMPRSSIETLLHAFVPAPQVDHTHPDTINMLAGSVNGEQFVKEVFGDEAVWVPYIRPGFTLAKQVGLAARGEGVRFVILAKHGLVTWGETGEESYANTIEAINRAADYVTAKAKVRFGGPVREPLSGEQRDELLAELLPAIRGAVSSERSKILQVDASPSTLEFVSSADAPTLSQVGAACPDHLVRTKRVPLWVDYDPAADDVETLAARIREGAATYRKEYVEDYFTPNANDGEQLSDPDPRVVLIQGVGMVSVGNTLKDARLARDLYQRAIEVMGGASAIDSFTSLTAPESFAVEYWPLELYKLAQAPAPKELQGKVAVVTGAAGGIGGSILGALASQDAIVVAADIDADGAARVAAEYGDSGLGVAMDVTSEEGVQAAYREAVLTYGGVDIVVSNAGIASSAPIEETSVEMWDRNHNILTRGYFLVAREAFKLLRRQASGGGVVFVASKNALVAGKNAAAYSSAKAAELHLARCLAEEGGAAGIRVNTVNPDAVLQGSRIWGSSWREERAAAYNIDPDQLEEHYRARTTLKVNILPEDIAQAVLHFASPVRSGKSTGNVLNVDGGVPAAYSR